LEVTQLAVVVSEVHAMRPRLLVGVVWGALLGVAGCSNPTTPSAPITIAGVATLSQIGQTAQLTVTSLGKNVTAQVTWQSSNLALATVSATGLVTAKGFGTTMITATAQGATTALTVTVAQPPAMSNSITACGVISAPGAYVLQTDLSQTPTSGLCLAIQANNVQLDCQNRTVTSLGFGIVNGVTVTNCNVATAVVNTYSLTNVTLAHNTLSGGFSSNGSQHLTLTNNHISGQGVMITSASFSMVTTNTLDGLNPTFQTSGVGAAIRLMGGTNNEVAQNAVDGGYDGSGNLSGLDDGIVLFDEANDTIQGNTISNVFDAGIESVDIAQNTAIVQNTIVNAGTAGIASFWCTNWTGNVIDENRISVSPAVLEVVYHSDQTKCGFPITVGGFTNNQIVGNRLLSPTANGQAPAGMSIVLDSLSAASVSNNVIQGNDLGSQYALVLRPATGFMNGGGNTCAPGSNPFCGGLVGDTPLREGSFLIGPAFWRWTGARTPSQKRYRPVNISF
jgi:hypothetical protein